MTVAVQALPIIYTGNGTAAPLAVPFRFLAPDHLVVTRISAATGARIVLTRGTHYSVSGAGSNSGGTVTPLAAIAVGDKWEIDRATPREQPTAYPVGDDFPAATHELALDRNMLVAQEQDRRASDIEARAPLALPGQIGPDFDVTGLGEGDLLEYRGGRLRRFDAAPFAGKYFGGAAVTGKPVPLTGTGGADAALRGDLASAIGDTLVQTVDGENLRSTLLNRVSVKSLLASGAFGEAVVDDGVWTAENTDDNALEALINDFRANFTRLFGETAEDDEPFKLATSLFEMQLQRRFFYITRDMPPLPPGCGLDATGSAIVLGNDNINVLWTEGGGQTFPRPGGTAISAYGCDYLRWKLPFIIANGHSGTFVRLTTVAHCIFSGLIVKGVKGSSYTVSGAITNGSRFIGLTPADYAKVKTNDIIDVGNLDEAGNPVPYQVKSRRVINPAATDRTYGYLKLDQAVVKTSGNYAISQLSFPVVCAGVQQSEWNHNYYTECDWKVYWGEGADEQFEGRNNGEGYGTNSDWLQESQTRLNPCTDMRIYYDKSEHCKYAVVTGVSTSMMNFLYPSWQFGTHGSEAIFNGINALMEQPRVENNSEATADLKEIPNFLARNGRVEVKGNIDWVTNGIGRYLFGQVGGSNVRIEGFATNSNESVPQMPDGTFAPFLKPASSGFLFVGDAFGMTGPTLGGVSYGENPYAWVTNGAGSTVYTNYRALATMTSGQMVRVGPYRMIGLGTDEVLAVEKVGTAGTTFAIQADGRLRWLSDSYIAPFGGIMLYNSQSGQHRFNGAIYVDNEKVVGARQAALPAAATDLATALTLLNRIANDLSDPAKHQLFTPR